MSVVRSTCIGIQSAYTVPFARRPARASCRQPDHSHQRQLTMVSKTWPYCRPPRPLGLSYAIPWVLIRCHCPSAEVLGRHRGCGSLSRWPQLEQQPEDDECPNDIGNQPVLSRSRAGSHRARMATRRREERVCEIGERVRLYVSDCAPQNGEAARVWLQHLKHRLLQICLPLPADEKVRLQEVSVPGKKEAGVTKL